MSKFVQVLAKTTHYRFGEVLQSFLGNMQPRKDQLRKQIDQLRHHYRPKSRPQSAMLIKDQGPSIAGALKKKSVRKKKRAGSIYNTV